MIEIIREEDWNQTEKRELPKDIKQIGSPDIGDRIYMENQVYQFLHPKDSITETAAYVLLGRFENYAGKQCTFVEAAIRLEEVAFEGDMPLWNDSTWAYIYKQLKKEYDSMVIVGWAMDIKGSVPQMTARLEQLHQNHFGGMHQILFLMDTLEQEEFFYGSRNEHLYRREGFYIYYNRDTPLPMGQLAKEQPVTEQERGELFGEEIFSEAYLQGKLEKNRGKGREIGKEKDKEKEEFWYTGASKNMGGNYRRQVLEKERRPAGASYASTFFLAVVVCVLGVTAYLNYQKMNAMEETLAQMQSGQLQATEQTTESTAVRVENVPGDVSKQENQATETSAASGDTSANTVPGALTDIIQPGGELTDTAQLAGGATDTAQASGTSQATGTTATVEETGQNAGTSQATGTTATSGGATETGAATAASGGTVETGATTATSEETPQAAEATGTSGETTQTAANTEAQKYLQQGCYIVQKGDSLIGICRKIYQTTAMMDKLCEANNIEDQDSIYAGQYLTLPN